MCRTDQTIAEMASRHFADAPYNSFDDGVRAPSAIVEEIVFALVDETIAYLSRFSSELANPIDAHLPETGSVGFVMTSLRPEWTN